MNDSAKTVSAADIAGVARENARLLYRVAFAVVRDAAAAEDVCQDALLKLVKDPGQVREWGQVRGWLVRAVTTGALTHLRRRKVEAKSVQTRWRPEAAGEADFLLREKLLGRLESLEPELRDVVVLRVMDGLSGTEVQTILGLSASDVSRRLHAGLNRLRGTLRELQTETTSRPMPQGTI